MFLSRRKVFSVELDVRRPDDGDVVGIGFVPRVTVVNPVKARRQVVGLTLIDLSQRGTFQPPPSTARNTPAAFLA